MTRSSGAGASGHSLRHHWPHAVIDTPVPWVELHSAATAQLLLTHLEASAPANVRYLSVTHGEHQFWRAKRLTIAGARDAGPVVYSLNESEGENAGYRAAQQLLQAHPDVDGVLVLIDTFASGAVRAFRTRHRHT